MITVFMLAAQYPWYKCDILLMAQYLFTFFVAGPCNCWHHQEAYLLRPCADQAVQGRARGRGQGEAKDGLQPGSD
jgi:hypothetical protein